MSEVILARNAGFCPGVRAAAQRLSHRMASPMPGERIFTLGHLIHNEDYNNDLARRGVRAVSAGELEALCAEACENAPVTVFIRAHGITREVRARLERLHAENPHFDFVDCTCTFVEKIHRIAREKDAERERYVFLCIGSERHPEVEGFMSEFDGECAVFSGAAELQAALEGENRLNFSSKVPVMVAQTTQNLTEWKNCQKLLKKYYTNPLIFDTICNVTYLRQTEAAELAAACDGMVVIGGKDSSNTAKLFEICRAICPDTLRITGNSDLELVKMFAKSHRKVGVAAGASTPSDIIEEVCKTMSEKNFAELFEETEVKIYKAGDVVTGTVTHVSDTELELDLGVGQTGYIKAERVSDDPAVKLTEAFKVGDTVEAKVVRNSNVDGIIELDKRRVDSNKNWEKVVAAKEEGTVLEAVVSDVVKGGVIVFVFGNRVFIPASQTGVPKDGDLAPLKGTTVKFKVIETKNDRGNKAIGSIRVVAREERRAAEEAFWASIEEGKTYTGVVKSMTSYGAFVDLGGVDGMVHTSELSWKHIKSPAEVVAIGDTITVFVKSFDAEKKRISLGYKTEDSNPWVIFTNQYQVGDVVPVKIVNMMAFGAFAEIIDGVDGLIHISQIAMTRIGKPADVLEIGQNVDAKIIEIDNDKKKVSLSIRALLEEVAAAEAAMPEDAEAAVEE